MRNLLAVLYTALIAWCKPGPAPTWPAAEAAARRQATCANWFPRRAAALPEAGLLDADDAAPQPGGLAGQMGGAELLGHLVRALPRTRCPRWTGLQAAMPEIAVVPVATGRNAVDAIDRLLRRGRRHGLPVLRDPKSELARGMGVMGLPVTVILNPEGEEVARLIGDAEWDSAEAQAVLAALVAAE